MNILPYIGRPYVIPTSDCWGIVRTFASEQLGKSYPEYFYSELNNEAMAQSIISMVDMMGLWKRVDDPQLGDVLIFRIMGQETHCGIYLGDGDFLHSLKGRMSCVENLNDANWQKRWTKTYRWLGS
jgi:cell wall-associated NlpC family hydrolase